MIGSRLAHYEITAHVGSGGMGHVYQATDSKLGRSVAIKMLPEEFARDAERIARLEREARTLASLNHPSIAAIYGLEESDGRSFLVMEYVAGETLAERIRRGKLPINEALAIALQIATALEAAHESSVMHRDLKPANIKVTKDGDVKLLDFGLAKAFAADRPTDLSHSPTVSVMATRVGVILGTAAYMSPEQAKGKEIDRRTDIFAFGCVLYEMLTGRQAFEGESASEILARVIEREPDWSRLPAGLPPRVRELLHRCLEKDPKKRRRDSGDVRLDLEQALAAPTSDGEVAERPAARHARGARIRWIALSAAAATAILIALGVAGVRWYWPVPEIVRFPVTIPRASDSQSLALSPDGRYLAYVAGTSFETALLFVRPLNSLEARALPGTEGANRPFWSPDGQHIGFAAQEQLKRVALAGGSPQSLADIGPVFLHGTWNEDDVILFSVASAIKRVSAAGGEVEDVTELDTSAGEQSHGVPAFLPGGRRFLYGTATGKPAVYAQSLASTERIRVLPFFAKAQYGSGFLVFNREGALLAQPFDADNLTFGGEPIRVADRLESNAAGVGPFTVSSAGVLAYRVEDTAAGLALSRLVWYGRDGEPLGVVGEPGEYRGVDLSPNGRHLAVHVHDAPAGADISVLDFERGDQLRPLALGPGHNMRPTWSPDADRIMYTRYTGTNSSVHQRRASGAGLEEPVFDVQLLEYPLDWSPDGLTALIAHGIPANLEISAVRLGDERAPESLVSTAGPTFAVFSPDGRWIAFVSNESGRAEVWVRPYTGSGGPWPVSMGGGNYPRWAPRGGELFYLTDDGTLMGVPVETGGAVFRWDSPRALFHTDSIVGDHGDAIFDMPYDVSTDGRFLINERVSPASANSGEPQNATIVVVVNWTAELRP